MEITKITSKVLKVKQVGIDFMIFDESFRRIRKGMRYEGKQCYRCNAIFEDGEKMSLVIFERYPNRLVCHSCGVYLSEGIK